MRAPSIADGPSSACGASRSSAGASATTPRGADSSAAVATTTDASRLRCAGPPRALRAVVARGVVLLAGLCLAAVGGAILFTPHAFHAMNGIALSADPSAMSEVRAPGAALLAIGAAVVAGGLHRAWLRASAALGAAVYLAYAAARALSIALDGVPHEGLLQALAIEVVLGAACLVVALGDRADRGDPATAA